MIDCWELVDLDGFKKKVKSGWVRTKLPEDASFSMFPLGRAECAHFYSSKLEEDFVKEVEDTIAKLQGKPSSETHCLKAFEQFLRTPHEENRTRLEAAYNDVPRHMRSYMLGDMDNKDWPIRFAIEKGADIPQETAEGLLKKYFPDEAELERRKLEFEEWKKKQQ